MYPVWERTEENLPYRKGITWPYTTRLQGTLTYSLNFHSSPGDLAVWSVDFVLNFDDWIVRSSAPTPAAGDPGVWTSAWIVDSGCTGWPS
ncbi:hypothetical protein TNIN_177211 [Trichonephila inaurata madagascariensis]|uniref:Uncharacterized protein n=1 Tax=Trichonephila inaurata madagascariensis TaxID=2747483 RepID=A0A8X7CD04_9ARAC|nr:hypothetical protein TNIN_177211 [Trichonephila inaurata madagascariensis]